MTILHGNLSDERLLQTDENLSAITSLVILNETSSSSEDNTLVLSVRSSMIKQGDSGRMDDVILGCDDTITQSDEHFTTMYDAGYIVMSAPYGEGSCNEKPAKLNEDDIRGGSYNDEVGVENVYNQVER